jgi:hypothetical protein
LSTAAGDLRVSIRRADSRLAGMARPNCNDDSREG